MKRSEQGLSLIETLVAVAVFGVAMLGLNLMLISTLRTSEHSRQLSTARFLAAQRLEQIKAASYEDGNRDAFRNPADPCTDIDELVPAVFFDEDYGAVDLLNGTRFLYENCAGNPDIKKTGVAFVRSNYGSDAQGTYDFEINHGQYSNFRREVYIIDTLDFTNSVRNVRLDGPNPVGRDNVLVEQVSPTVAEPATNYIKFVMVRVKWLNSRGDVHHVTLSTERAFYIPSF